MILKIVVLFLVGMGVLAMFGKLHLLGLPGTGRKRGAGRLGKPGKCPACGRYRIGKGPCPCGGKATRKGS